MLKMTLLLVAGLYGTLVVWGEPTGRVAAAPGRAAIEEAVAASMPDYARPVILDGAGSGTPDVTRAATTRTVVPEASELAADSASSVRAIGEPRMVSLLQPEAPASTAVAGPSAGTGATVLRVNGSRVNMRSGPSTADAVVASLPEGTLAEPIGEAVGGWREVRVVETGLTGYMAARFLDPA